MISAMKDIFLPKKINSFYLFTQRIVALEVQNNALFATVIRAHRDKKTIQKFFEEPYNPHEQGSLEGAIKNIIQKIGAYDSISIVVQSSLAIFKTITLPFINEEKIKLILPFEVEPLLPFSIQDSVIDALVYPNITQKNSEVLVVAVKRSFLDDFLQPFFSLGIHPDRITVGSLELYALIKQCGALPSQGISCIVDFAFEKTTIMLLLNGKITAIRVINEGISVDATRIDFTVPAHQLPSELKSFFSKLQFTVQAMIKTIILELSKTENNSSFPEKISSVLITGICLHCAYIKTAIENLLGCPCTLFQTHTLLHDDGIVMMENKHPIQPEYMISLAAALNLPETEHFNLAHIYNEERSLKLFKYQIITTTVLVLFIFLSFAVFSFLSTRKLRNEIAVIKEETRRKVSSEFAIETNKKDSMDTIINNAQQKLTTEKSIWFALSQNQRRSFLYYLQELETHIDPDELHLTMKRLSIKRDDATGEDTIRLEGNVGDFYAAVKLTEDLKQTNLFVESDIKPLQNTAFDIRLTINKQNEVNV